MGFWENIWNILLVFLYAIVVISYLFALISVIGDLFRDHKLSGWAKALWIIGLIFIPFLTLVVYLIARGNGMARRSAEAQRDAQTATDAYIREAAGRATPSDEIATAKALLDSGAISTEEFEHLKAKALARS
ncbi:SHOCT domain-containing protein [Mycetocola spongiae]|uniref:SHOCT domain-containing protein n=1 Tax=Mycetocola spongiae TaxID=2859226 RepID=UPI001CF581B5|nr:SHOCT domain-containing protein [Mycetocola spongiae]UCR89750.1 SHOCT domain-containing protein [Mycetocola spongiae]